MPIRPFLFTDTVALAANGQGTILFAVSAGETARISDLGFVSTGAFNVRTIRDATGQRYTDASADNPIASTMLTNLNNANNGFGKLPIDLEVEGPTDIAIELTDTSGSANTVRFLAMGSKDTG